jgi:hypothetical protein
MSGELQDSLDLFARHSKFVDEFVNAHILQVLENSRDGRASPPENPRAATLARNAFYGRTLRPIKTWHDPRSFSFRIPPLRTHRYSLCDGGGEPCQIEASFGWDLARLLDWIENTQTGDKPYECACRSKYGGGSGWKFGGEQ